MDLMWNKAELDLEFGGCETLSQVVKKISNSSIQHGFKISGLVVNGESLEFENNPKNLELEFSRVETLEVGLSDLPMKLGNLLTTQLDLIELIQPSLLEVADSLRLLKIEDSMAQLQEVLDQIQLVIEALVVARPELNRMGTDIYIEGNKATIKGIINNPNFEIKPHIKRFIENNL